jgi:hypothetical protein
MSNSMPMNEAEYPTLLTAEDVWAILQAWPKSPGLESVLRRAQVTAGYTKIHPFFYGGC